MRVVRAPDGSLGLDLTGRAPGRGAYLCRDASCWDAAGRKHAVEHALKVPAGAVDELLAAGIPGAAAHASMTVASGGQPAAGEGEAEHRSERAQTPVSEERTRQRTNAAGSPPPHESDSNDPEGGAHGQE